MGPASHSRLRGAHGFLLGDAARGAGAHIPRMGYASFMGFESREFAPARRLFLGVERSACGRAWRDRLDERGSVRALAIAQRHDVPELLARILAGREVEVDEVASFLDPTVRALMPDPDTLVDMHAAAM